MKRAIRIFNQAITDMGEHMDALEIVKLCAVVIEQYMITTDTNEIELRGKNTKLRFLCEINEACEQNDTQTITTATLH